MPTVDLEHLAGLDYAPRTRTTGRHLSVNPLPWIRSLKGLVAVFPQIRQQCPRLLDPLEFEASIRPSPVMTACHAPGPTGCGWFVRARWGSALGWSGIAAIDGTLPATAEQDHLSQRKA